MPQNLSASGPHLRQDVYKWGHRLLMVMNVAVLVGGTWFICSRGLAAATPEWSYQDLVTILLAVVSVLLGILGLFIAILAIWGYSSLKTIAENKAEEVAERVARDVAGTAGARSGAATSETVEEVGDGNLADALKDGTKDG